MPIQLLFALLILSPLSFLFSFAVYQGETTRVVSFVPGSELLPNLPPEKIGKVEIRRLKETIQLKRDGQGFVVVSENNYPAKNDKINEFLRTCREIVTAEEVTRNSLHHEKFGLKVGSSTKEFTQVQFFDEGDKPLAGLVVGERNEKRKGNYVRDLNRDIVYVSEEAVNIPARGLDFIDQTILNYQRGELQTVECDAVKMVSASDSFRLENLPPGKRAKGQDYLVFADAISYLNFDAVIPVADSRVKDVKFDRVLKAKLKNLAQYNLSLGVDKEEYFLKVQGEWTGESNLQVPKDAPKEELEKIEAKLKLNQKIQSQNANWVRWVYKIPKYKADTLLKNLAELIEDIPPAPVASATAMVSEKIILSHILVAYEGAVRSEVKGRTKEEALKRAEELLAKVEKDKNQFATLAKENSDCPSKDKEGSLGEVAPGTMAPEFEKAGFALKVGEISKVVETPFGFHIIRRD